MIHKLITRLYYLIFGNGLAYRSPFWYDMAELFKRGMK
jgi:hypothetical protein